MRVCGDHGPLFVADRGEHRIGLRLESVEEVGVAVAHHAEDVIDVLGEGECDVGGDGGHGEAFPERNGWGPYVSRRSRVIARTIEVRRVLRAPFSGTGRGRTT